MSVRRIDLDLLSTRAQVLQRMFSKRIVGQNDATTALSNVLERYLSGFYDRKRPIASLLFLGPTGTGKTSSVEAFVEGLFGSTKPLIKIDCAEYQHGHEIAKLIGSPPGYLGHRETHPLLNQKRIDEHQTPDLRFAVLLFDEIEKASDTLWNLLLGILDKGSLTTGDNSVVDLTRTVIIMTSNVGSKEMSVAAGEEGLGFTLPLLESFDQKGLKNISVSAARRKFQPEFLNRIDELVMFNTLTEFDITQIVEFEMTALMDRIANDANTFIIPELSPSAKARLIKEGYDRRYNARNLKRVFEKRVIIPISRAVSTGQAKTGDRILIDYYRMDEKWCYYAEVAVRGIPSVYREPQQRLALRETTGAADIVEA